MAITKASWLAACLFLFCCYPVPKKVQIRRMGAAHLELCILNNFCHNKGQCFRRAEAYCLDAGLEKQCAFMEPEWTPCLQ